MSEKSGYREAVRSWASEHHVPDGAVTRWLESGPVNASAILAFAQDLRLRTGQLVSALELLEEIAVREGEGAAAILARPELRRLLEGGGSRPQRASALLEKLRELRYPRLTQTHARLEAAAAAMRLPPGPGRALAQESGL